MAMAAKTWLRRSGGGMRRAATASTASGRPAAGVWCARDYNSKIDVGALKVISTTTPREKLAYEKLQFGRTFSDHMLEIDWDEKNGWHNPVIKPYGPFAMSPAASVLHYGIEVRFFFQVGSCRRRRRSAPTPPSPPPHPHQPHPHPRSALKA